MILNNGKCDESKGGPENASEAPTGQQKWSQYVFGV
jgi:hypothetical protein